MIYESLLTSYIHTRLNIILSYFFQALDFLYVKLFLVHKRRKRKRLISQFLQSRIEGLINWIWGGFHASWVFKWFFEAPFRWMLCVKSCCFIHLFTSWKHNVTYMIKLSVNETKWSILLARTHAPILFISIWIFDFGPEKLLGLWRNGQLTTSCCFIFCAKWPPIHETAKKFA